MESVDLLDLDEKPKLKPKETTIEEPCHFSFCNYIWFICMKSYYENIKKNK
jgi:hypothetical protein